MRVKRISSLFTRIHTIPSLSSTPSRPSKHTSTPYSTLLQTPQTPHEHQYSCPVNAEPLHRYTTGGYHPITLGSLLHQGRYKILHKLGWGGYSTVWAARDEQYTNISVSIILTLKITYYRTTANRELFQRRERASRDEYFLRNLNDTQHIVRMFDYFDIRGPNGIHPCLVLEMLGPSVADLVEGRFADGRLPGSLARDVARQAMVGLDALQRREIAHGDFHIRNLAFTIPSMANIPEDEFINLLGKPDIGLVRCNDGGSLGPGIPEYIVRSANLHLQPWPLSKTIKIVDFGESFPRKDAPETLHTPLVVRAPEVIFKDRLDHRVDLWSLGCMLFELFVGQPPFDSFLITPKILVEQMQEITNGALPDRWVPLWKSMRGKDITGDRGPGLQEWLEEMYFDGERKEDLSKDDIVELGRIIRKLLQFEPGARASVEEILNDPWF
ncbi:kinase-like protein [Aspergillus eucalypticola CBS 122712]|uniref:Kinase-like protein n=1 Tax=Aspergillus eucalypticola (strain CBS 122712 / IBT 29274) TaxID=1448314 RepID=A0A317UUT4_ASPEC|nr:kinase-like protein [Aspergillus eucalypticola CBS 122712]PWY63810.1 kinase-like protein [Aspergillus eucalypticola CBS 122712]